MERKKTLTNRDNIDREEQSWRVDSTWLPDTLESYSNADGVVWRKNRHADQGNGIESSEVDLGKYGQWIFDAEAKAIIPTEQRLSFQQMVFKPLHTHRHK